ncbi:MAG: glutathione S-transferase [Caulobacter sp.]|nr:glutathione S-transferase [Caulobacter sp.]
MSLTLYGHPFSSYTQKALIALWENGTEFTYRSLEEPGANEELEALWPLKRFPVLVDDRKTILEATCIIEHLNAFHPGPVKLIPADDAQAVEVRTMDRIFDNYVMTQMQVGVFNAIRPDDAKDPYGVAQGMEMLLKAYHWLDGKLTGRTWAAGEAFSMADCAAAPSLFYADWVLPIPEALTTLKAYRARLLAHPSVVRAVDGGRPYRGYFPLGAPDRD